MDDKIVAESMDLFERFSTYRLEKPKELFLIDELNGSYSWKEGFDKVEAIAKSLKVLLGSQGERVSILSENCSDWILADLGIMLSGHVSAPLFTTMMADKFSYAVSFLDVKLMFLGNAPNWDNVKSHVPDGLTIVSLPHVEPHPGTMSFAEFIAQGKAEPVPCRPDLDAVCSLILTSGTTGKPKAVMHSQRTLNSIADTFLKINRQERLPEKRLLCHLPMAHIGEKVTVLQSLFMDASITIGRGPGLFIDDLRKVRPTLVLGVPRIWERLLQIVIDEFADSIDELKFRLEQEGNEELPGQIREFLGLSEATCCISGGAISPQFVKDWFLLFGVEISDFYGQTEIVPLTCQGAGDQVAGSVGSVTPGFELVIEPSGEILGRGPGAALGYFEDEENTALTFRDGWVHTGDKGYLDQENNLFIVGRMRDEFKTAKGKYVAPGPIESRFAGSPLVEQQLLFGLGLTQPLMICTLSAEATGKSDVEIEDTLLAETRKVNLQLEPHERIGGVLISRTHWTVENGLLTHTQKAIRDKIFAACSPQVAEVGAALRDGQRNIMRWV